MATTLEWATVLTMAASKTMSESDGVVLNRILDKEDLSTLPDLVSQAFMNASASNNFQMASEILSKREKYLSRRALLKARHDFEGNKDLSRKIFSSLSKLGAGEIKHHPGSIQVQTWTKK